MKSQDVLQHVEKSMRKNGLDEKLIKSILAETRLSIEESITQKNLHSLKSERHQNNLGGRPKALTKESLKLASELMKNTQLTAREISNKVGVSRATLYRYLKPDGSARNA